MKAAGGLSICGCPDRFLFGPIKKAAFEIFEIFKMEAYARRNRNRAENEENAKTTCVFILVIIGPLSHRSNKV